MKLPKKKIKNPSILLYNRLMTIHVLAHNVKLKLFTSNCTLILVFVTCYFEGAQSEERGVRRPGVHRHRRL